MRRHSSECFNKHRLMWSVSVSGTRVSCCWSIAWCQWNSFIYIVIYIVLFVPLCWCSASVFDILCVVTVCLMTPSNSAFPCINLLSLRLSYRWFGPSGAPLGVSCRVKTSHVKVFVVRPLDNTFVTVVVFTWFDLSPWVHTIRHTE